MDFDEYERGRWQGRAAAYRRSFGWLCAHPAADLLDAAGVGAGTRLLDVGTGTGTVAGLAVGRGATVSAVDAESSMVEAARAAVPDADIRRAVLPDLPYQNGSFDAVVANFVLNHVGDPAAAVAELARLVRPGGRVAVTIWPYPQPPLQALWGEAVAAAGVPPVPVPRLDPARDFPRTAAGLSGLLSAALSGVSVRRLDWAHRADPDEWWAGPAGGVATIGHIVTSHPGAAERVRREYERLSAPYLGADGMLSLPTGALLASGQR